MSYAYVAAVATTAFCVGKFEDVKMASTWFNGGWADAFDHTGYATHKYFPAGEWSRELGLPAGSGVYGGWKMRDGSWVLLTCAGALAYWSKETGACWPPEVWLELPERYREREPRPRRVE